jgi:DNA replication protein DnaC
MPTFAQLSEISDDEFLDREAQYRQRKLQETVDAALREANLPARHLKQCQHSGERWLGTFERVKARMGTGFIIALIGGRGVGKTQMAVEVCREQARREKTFHYATAMDVFLEIKDSYRKGGSERDAVKTFIRPGLLILDEVQERGETPWEDRLLTYIIDKRYAAQKDTLLISNQNKETFLDAMGHSVASRIGEAGGTIVFDWPSYRLAAKS